MQLLGTRHGAGHALRPGGEHHLGSVGADKPPALDAHGVGHGDDEAVAFGRAHHGEADAGIARGRFDDGVAGSDAAVGLRFVDHGQGHAVLYRAGWVEIFKFGKKRAGQRGLQAGKPHHGGVAYKL